MIRYRFIQAAVTATVLSLCAPLTVARAQDPVEETLVQLVEQATPTAVPLLEASFEEGAFEAQAVTTETVVTIPESPEDTIVVDAPTDTADGAAASVGISLPEQVDSQNGQLTDSGAVVYASAGSNVDVVVQPVEDGSVRINTVVYEPAAAHEYTYQLSLPESAALKAQKDGSVVIMDGANFVGGIAAPWAADAAGVPVETHYVIEGDSVTQILQPTPTTQYPIVADPWLGIALVSKTVWQWQATYGGYTLKVYPTWWGRYGVYPTLGVGTYIWLRSAFWNEVKSKTAGTREETSSMRDQFYCHVDVVRLRYPNKESWNLDTWRPRVSYATMIARQCNP